MSIAMFHTAVFRYRIWLPVLSAILLILSLPPIGVNSLVFVGLVPMFVYSYTATTPKQAALGWSLFSFVYVSYITYSTILGFHWISEARLFVEMVNLLGILATVCAAAFFWIVGYVTKVCEQFFMRSRLRPHRFVVVAVFAMVCAVSVDYILFTVFKGFNYGALFFAGQQFEYLLGFIDLGHPVMISLAVVLVNVVAFATLLYATRRLPTVFYAGALVVLSFYMLVPQFVQDAPAYATESVASVEIAIIQDSDREESTAFGKVENGTFVFRDLEVHLATLRDAPVDYVIYPFAPWNGVMGQYSDNARFDRKVIAIDEVTFGAWLKQHVPPQTTFVTWFTTYTDGVFYNQIVFYRDGVRVGTYNKRHLFPFFDYTPAWALKLGIVSLPMDGTPGAVDQQSVALGDARIGSLVCSEIGDDSATAMSAIGSNMLFSIGSESMFTHQIPGEYNALRAQQSAEKLNLPVIRANKFGPSVVYDGDGQLLGSLGFNETGVLRVTVLYAPFATKE